MPNSLQNIFELESHIEGGFKDSLVLQGVLQADSIFVSRRMLTKNTPWVEIKAVVGSVARHEHLLSTVTQAKCWDAWQGKLETMIATNRSDNPKDLSHQQMLGRVRCALQLFNTDTFYKNQIVRITDIRESPGTEDTFTDDQNCDFTKISWFLLFNINPESWPSV